MSHIILIPTSHIAQESIRKIEETIRKEKPDCVAVELDAARYAAFHHRGRPSFRQLGLWSFVIFSFMRFLQQWLGKAAGVMPGKDMVTAVEVAKQHGIPVYFIDRHIQETLLRFKSLPREEKLRLFTLLVKGVVLSRLGKGKKIDLRKVPQEETVQEAMNFLSQELPYFYTVLVKERDEFMAHQLLHLSRKYEKIIAVVGAGHRQGIQKILTSSR